MGMVRKSLRAVLVALGWICALLALGIPVWFAAAAFGTKWGFFDTATGLDWMTRGIGRPLLLAAVAAVVRCEEDGVAQLGERLGERAW